MIRRIVVDSSSNIKSIRYKELKIVPLKIITDKKEYIDELGLDEIDRKLLDTMIVQYAGRPVGIETLAVTVGEEVDTIEDVYEPYLIQIGFIARTLRGRMVLPPASAHLGYEYNEG